VISVAYYALTSAAKLVPVSQRGSGGTNLATLHVPWEGERGGRVEVRDGAGRRLPLAFDHAQMLGLVVQRLRGKLDYAPIGFELLPRQFTLRDLQAIHETILGRRLNKDSFRRRMMATGLIEATGRLEEDVGHRPAELYRFRRQHGRRKGE
jgi:8-oxo-dGTP diphosphatase